MQRQVFAARSHDASILQHVHEIGLDVIQQALVVGDDDDRALGGAHRVHPFRNGPERVDVESGVGLVEHRQLRLEHGHLENLVALLLAAREPLVDRPAQQRRIEVEDLGFLFHERHELHGVELGKAAMLPLGVDGGLQEVRVVDAGNFHGVLERHEDALAGAIFRRELDEILAVVGDRSPGDFDLRMAGQRAGERALARAVRPHDGVDFALLDAQVDAAEDVFRAAADLQIR